MAAQAQPCFRYSGSDHKCKMVEREGTSPTREFNHYSVYDWTTWLAYGSSPFSQPRLLRVKDEINANDSRDDRSGAASATPAVGLSSSGAGTSPGEGPVPKKKYDLRAPIQAAESSPGEKQFFDSLGVLLSNGGVGFFMGSSLAYIAETRKSAPTASSSFNREIVSEEALRTPVHTKSSSSQTINPYQRAMASNMVKPELRGVEDLARRVAMKGAQTAALASAFSVALEVNDHYLQRKRDPAAYAVGGAMAGIAHGLVSRPFAPVSTIKKTVVMGAAGAAFSFVHDYLQTTPTGSSP